MKSKAQRQRKPKRWTGIVERVQVGCDGAREFYMRITVDVPKWTKTAPEEGQEVTITISTGRKP